MNIMQSIKTCFDKYATFSGRAQRSEFWWFILFVVVGSIIAGRLDVMVFGPTFIVTETSFEYNAGYIGIIFFLATLLPNISVMVRRLHDVNKSGWWYWFMLIPLIGVIMLLVWFIKTGTSGSNNYGNDPLS
ncbi:MAG: DUF805 domain-containing protein, partial [Rhodobacteraceae bacterium]|nr:DUF805 domain-containing protein [Paracoccaceae bacterium]